MKSTSHTTSNTKPDKLAVIKAYFDMPEIRQQFDDVLGKRAPGFIVGVLQLVAGDELLKLADLQSLGNAAIRAAILNLPLDKNLHLACITGLKEKGTGKVFAQFQIEWRGFVQLCQRTGKFKLINVFDVREGELKEINFLSGEYTWDWCQDNAKRNALPVIGYGSYFKTLAGFENTVYWPLDKIHQHASSYSDSYLSKDSYWQTHFPDMSKKTVLKENLSKWAELSNEMAMAIEVDQAVITGAEAKIEYMDNPISEGKKETTKRASNVEAAAAALKNKLNKK